MTYCEWFEDGSISMLTMWHSMHDDLMRGFKGYTTVEDMWDPLGIQFDQIHPLLKTLNLRMPLPKE